MKCKTKHSMQYFSKMLDSLKVFFYINIIFFYINKYSKSANRLIHNAMCLQIICTFSLYTQRKKEKMLSCKDIATLKKQYIFTVE